jgi:hypothetical protein
MYQISISGKCFFNSIFLSIALLLLLTGGFKVYSQPTFERLYGTIDNDAGNTITRCTGGGYLATGTTMNYYYGDPEIYMVRISEYGDTLWTKTYSNPFQYDRNVQVCEHTDNSYLLGNHAESDSTRVFIQKYDITGNEIWMKYYSAGELTYFTFMTSTPDSGIAFCGYYMAVWPMYASAYIIKTDNQGNELWRQSFTGSYLKQYYTQRIGNTLDHGFIVSASVDYPEFEKDKGVLIKLSPSGQNQWVKEYEYPQAGRSFFIRDCKQLADSSYIAIGVSYDVFLYGNKRPVLMKTDKSGNFVWFKQLDLLEYDYQTLNVDSDNSFILTGPENASMQVLETNEAGEILSSVSFESEFNAMLNQIIPSNDSGYIMTGSAATYSGYGGSDVVILKANHEGILTRLHETESADQSLGLTVWPNPCSDKIQLKCIIPISSVSIYNPLGNCIYENNCQPDFQNDLIIETSAFPTGLLLIRYKTSQGIYSEKIIKQ